MDFVLPAELARRWPTRPPRSPPSGRPRTPFPEDSWIVGHDAELAKELAARGWIGMTWPVEEGGGGRTPLERFVVFEQLIAGGAPIAAMWFADRQMGPTLLQFGTDGAAPALAARHPRRRVDVVHRHVRARRRLRRRRRSGPGPSATATTGSSPARRCGRRGAAVADWMLPDRPHRSRRAAARRAVRVRRRHARRPASRSRRIVDMTGNDHFCEVTFDDVRVPGRQPRRRAQRQLPPADAPDGARAGRHRPARVEPAAVSRTSCRAGWVDTDDPLVRQELAAIETGYRIGRLLVLRETLGQAPDGFSAATKTFCTEFEQRVAEFCARRAGPDATLLDADAATSAAASPGPSATRRPTRSWAAPTQILRNILGERVLGLPTS